MILPGDVNFVGTLYSLGATLSFTIAHVSIVRLRMQDAVDAEIPYRARPNVRIGATAWPLFALLGGLATGVSFLVLVVQNPLTRWVGLGWMVAGLVGYAVYRRRFLRVGLRAIEKAPPALGQLWRSSTATSSSPSSRGSRPRPPWTWRAGSPRSVARGSSR